MSNGISVTFTADTPDELRDRVLAFAQLIESSHRVVAPEPVKPRGRRKAKTQTAPAKEPEVDESPKSSGVAAAATDDTGKAHQILSSDTPPPGIDPELFKSPHYKALMKVVADPKHGPEKAAAIIRDFGYSRPSEIPPDEHAAFIDRCTRVVAGA